MLTFDDGPIAGATEKIVNELKCFKVDGGPVKACFFMVGDSDPLYHSNFEFWERKGSVRANADVVQHVVNAGHLLGNHTYHHAWFDWYHDPDLGGAAAERLRREYGCLKDFARDEIGRCSLEIEKAGRGVEGLT
jgi:peptidoglycan/xylan/chitin deacetylase (PgdA/CDA1 family)